jgi:hypothetical protein
MYRLVMVTIEKRKGIRLNPENARRLEALAGRTNMFSVNRLANIVLAMSLHEYEANVNKLLGTRKK